MKRLGTFLSVLVVGALVVRASGDEKAECPVDKDFLIKAASGNQAEVHLGKLANKRAASSQVKDYATMLVKDHQQASEKLARLLKNRTIGVVTGLEKETRDELNRLGKLEGADFDRAFVHCMVKDHQKDIAMFENQAKNGKEEDLRNYAKETLPTLRKHLSMAQELVKTVGK